MPQAIVTKYLPATNNKSSRIKASCERGSIIKSYPMRATGDDAHREIAKALIAKFCNEDLKEYGTPIDKNPWNRPFVTGGIDSGNCVHVFLGQNEYSKSQQTEIPIV